MNEVDNDGFWVVFVLTLILAVVLVGAMAMWTERSVEFWLFYIKGVHIDIPYWLALVITALGNCVVTFINIITELFRLVV